MGQLAEALCLLLILCSLFHQVPAFLLVDEGDEIVCTSPPNLPLNFTTGVNVNRGSRVHKRQATDFQPIRVHYEYQDLGVATTSQELRLEEVHRRMQNYLASTLSVIPPASSLLLARACSHRGAIIPGRDQHTCLHQCEPGTHCIQGVNIPLEHLQACVECNGDTNNCSQTIPDGAGVEADIIIYYSLSDADSSSGVCRGPGPIAFAFFCQLEANLDRPIAGFIEYCASTFDQLSDEQLFRVALHETIHLLGFTNSLYRFFRDENGAPLSERGPDGFPVSFGFPDETTLRAFAHSDYATISGDQIRSTHILVLPNIREHAANHFGCPLNDTAGVELEDGTLELTSDLSHWEARQLGDEIMTAHMRRPSPLSNITLALLEDTGWYRVNYSMAEPLAYGSQAGCDFLNDSCLSHIARQRTSGNALRPYCDILQGRPDSYRSCSLDRNYLAECDLMVHEDPLRDLYQYFTFGANFDSTTVNVTHVGGHMPAPNFCPYYEPLIQTLCSDVSNLKSEELNVAGELHGPQSRCFEHGRGWTRTDIHTNAATTTMRSAGCYQFACTSSGVNVRVMGTWFECRCEQEELQFNLTVGNFHYQGSLICPSCTALCYDDLESCPPEPSPCPGNITVIAGVNFDDLCENGGSYNLGTLSCDCPVGYAGNNCSIDIDYCLSNPCVNGGTCIDEIEGFQCECLPGFGGTTCEIDIEDCVTSLCQNRNLCNLSVPEIICRCEPSNTDEDCSNCAVQPCRNGSSCVTLVDGFSCACAPGYMGERCLDEIDECVSNPCVNGGTCMDGVNGFSCQCVAGYIGETCTSRSQPSTGTSGVNVGVIAGAVIGGMILIAAIAVIIFLVIFFHKSSRKKSKVKDNVGPTVRVKPLD